MIETLISSKTRIKLLLKFFLNSKTTSYLRGLEQEFGESSNAIRLELNKLEKAGMLTSFSEGNKKMFQANQKHPLFTEIHSIVLKHIGIDRIIKEVVNRLGDIKKVYLTGDFSRGKDSPIIDLIFIGDLDENYLLSLIKKVEKIVKRRIRYLIYNTKEIDQFEKEKFASAPLLLWSLEK